MYEGPEGLEVPVAYSWSDDKKLEREMKRVENPEREVPVEKFALSRNDKMFYIG